MIHCQCFSPTLNLLNGLKADARNDYRTIGNTNRALYQNYYFKNPFLSPFCCQQGGRPPQSQQNNGMSDLMNQFMQTMLFMKFADNI